MRQLAILVLLGALAVPAGAQGRSVFDPDIGWPAALRARYKIPKVATRACTRDITRRDIRIQSLIDRRGDPREGLRKIFHYRWGVGGTTSATAAACTTASSRARPRASRRHARSLPAAT